LTVFYGFGLTDENVGQAHGFACCPAAPIMICSAAKPLCRGGLHLNTHSAQFLERNQLANV
jgi:hypothetical protein